MKNDYIRKNAEKIINYLSLYEVNDIKLIYVKKEKFINTITKNNISHNVVYEDGFSISFNVNETNYMLALNNLSNFNYTKKQINNFLKYNKIKNNKKNNKKIIIDSNFFENKDKKNECFKDIDYQQKILEFIKKHNDIINISIILLHEKKNTNIISLSDKYICKEENNYKIDILMNAVIKGIDRFNYCSIGCSNDLKKIKNINLCKEFDKLLSTILKMHSLSNINQKCDVVISNGIGGILFHETCGHSLESREIIKKTSVFNNMKNLENNNINLIDNPKLINEFGSFEIDDEGNYSKCIQLIKNGNIINYLCDSKGKTNLNCESSSCRRESYYNIFSSRMSNTYIAPGKEKFDDIILSVQNGFFVKNILGGVVDTLSGNFSFNCLEAYRIKDGIIDYSKCFDNLTIVGNAVEVIKNVDKIGNDLDLACGICGSTSGFIYTTVGQPTIKIKNLLVVS